MYFLDITRFYRIWFSPNPNQFMNTLNCLRLIRFRQRHPGKTIFLIYSTALLCHEAEEALLCFCKTHEIFPISFEKYIPQLLESELDRSVYQLAQAEIQHTQTHTGGNLGAAADCTKLLCAVIAHFGIYSDFDVELSFPNDRNQIEIQSPIVLPIETTTTDISINCDFIGVAQGEDPSTLLIEAHEIVTKLQTQLLKHYRDPSQHLFYSPIPTTLTPLIQRGIHVFNFYQCHYEQHVNLFSFRSFLQYARLQQPNNYVFSYLLRRTNIFISGPLVYYSIIEDYSDWKKALASAAFFSLHRTLTNYFVSKNSLSACRQNVAYRFPPSWTADGEVALQKVERDMEDAARKIQFCFRDFRMHQQYTHDEKSSRSIINDQLKKCTIT